MSDRMPPSPPRPPKFPGSGRPESPNWGVWVMVLLIVGVLAFGFFTPESFGLGPRKENLESFEAQYKAGRVVLNDPKAPVEVVLSENGSEGVIHALVYRKEIQPKVEMTPFALTYSMSLPDRDKPLLNELSGYRVVESPYRTEEGKNVSLIPEGAQKLSVPEFNRLALEGRIAGGKDGIILAEDGNQNVLVGQIVTRIWPAATGDASVDKQRFERVEVPFTLEFQGDRVKQLLGPDTKFKRESGSWGGILLNFDADYASNVRNQNTSASHISDTEVYGHCGVTPELEQENASITLSMPMSRKQRPYWDQEFLENIGFSRSGYDLSVGQNILKEHNLKDAPMFLVWGVR